MNNFLQFLLIATVLVSSASSSTRASTLRGSIVITNDNSQDQDHQDQQRQRQQLQYQRALKELNNSNTVVSQSEHHRHLTEETMCKLYIQDTIYDSTGAYPPGYSVEEWVCLLPPELSAKHGGLQYVDIVDPESVEGNVILAYARSGISILTVSEAIIDVQESKMYIPRHSRAGVNDEHSSIADQHVANTMGQSGTTDNNIDEGAENALRREPRRTNNDDHVNNNQGNQNLAKSMGNLKALVIRVSALDSEVTSKPDELRNKIFEDGSCLATQYAACSNGKMTISPYQGTTLDDGTSINGILDVQVNLTVSENKELNILQTAAFKVAQEKVGDLHSSEFDLVMFCMPPGTGGWAAFALVNNKFSYYNNERCTYVSAQMHEIGHNLNLANSGQDGESLTSDNTGFMGFTPRMGDTYMCFNPAKNYQLGWYNEKVQDYNPLAHKDAVRTFTMNGVSDYRRTIKDESKTIVVRLEMPDMIQDYYIGYNRKDGINRDTIEDEDKITVVRKEAGLPKEYGASSKNAALSIGQSYVIENFNDEKGRSIEIKYAGNTNDGLDAIVTVTDVKNAPKPEKAPCANHVIELTTDKYPQDNSWAIVEDGGIGGAFGNNPEYKDANTLYTTTVCLPYNKKYIFRIVDTYKDGLCCNQGEGSFRGLDQDGRQLFAGGKYNPREFHVDEFKISVGPNPEPDPEFPEVDSDDENHEGVVVCKDRKGKFDWSGNSKKRKRNCRWIAKKKKCGKTDGNGEKVW
eukprot:CAMPEP_0168299850 /NCGR_PEP_ID=MMETSP0142_2-20121227/28369_1 /TAXON_ID=44445 /ORGANISM="Pseudo-nitzschia australis, Strain 10249 10 AB" /LENGTH=745 /DNA_ID=CAMNT_0008249651 /DNA_START=212 /DNA_END=2446 /DNA_ORIENTATION=+